LSNPELRALLDATLAGDRPHVEKLTVTAAVVSAVLRREGMEATLVGGGAIEFHAAEIYTTSDIDLVVEGRTRAAMDSALTAFGMTRSGRHWLIGGMFIEVPGNAMTDPTETAMVGPLPLRVVRREIALADRIIGFRHWGATGYGAQAVAMLALFGATLDEAMLLQRLRDEGAVDALEPLRLLARSESRVDDAELGALLDRLKRGGGRDNEGEK